MKGKITTYLLLIFIIGAGAFVYYQKSQNRSLSDVARRLTKHNLMKLNSPAFANNQPIPKIYTCDGDSASPQLKISEVPPNTQSLALLVDDPDAPSRPFVHWIMFNIPPDTTEINNNEVPVGAVVAKNSAGQNNYAGPCPPSGTHHYHFKLYALTKKLNIDQDTDKDELLAAMAGNIINQTELVGTYSRD